VGEDVAKVVQQFPAKFQLIENINNVKLTFVNFHHENITQLFENIV
jgi:hypothetical protein